MAGSKSNTHENDVLIYWLRPGDAAPTRPASLQVALLTADPGEAASLAGEVGAGVGYSRQTVTFDAPASGATQNTGALAFGPASGAGFGTVSHWAVIDNNGVVRYHGTLNNSGGTPTPQTVNAGGTLNIAAGALDVSED